MDELFLKMHEEAMYLQQTVTELKCILTNLQDAIETEEIDRASNKYYDRKDVEIASIECRKLKKIIGMAPEICRRADELMKEREGEGNE